EARLAGLSDEERKGLELVAIGEPLPLAVLEQLVSADTVERLEVRRLLEAGREVAEPEVRLAHPLYGEVVRATLPGVRRARLSRLLADALEERGELHGADILRVAVWRLDGGGGSADAIAAAARRAFRSEDYELAERLGRAGWERWQRTDAAFVLGEVLDLLGRADEADEILAAASEVVTSDNELTSLAIRRASLLFRSGRPEDAEAVVAEAMARVKDVSCRRELDAIQGDHLLLAGQVARAIELDRPLLDGPMDAAFAQASLDVGTALVLAGRTQEAMDHTSAALAVRLDLDDASHLSRTGVYVVAHTMALAGAGRLAEASAMAEQAYEVALEQRAMDGQAWLGAVLAQTRLAEGRVRTAGTLFREITSLFEQLRHPGLRWGLGGIALAAGQLGDHAMSRAAIEELDRTEQPTVRLMDVGVMRGRAWANVAANDLMTARRTLWDAYELAQDWGQLAGAADALHDLVRIGARGSAVKLLIELEKEVDGELMVARAVYAHAAGVKDPAMAKEATDRFEDLGALLFAAESAALEHSLARDRQLSRQAAAAAARSGRLLEQCEGARTPALSVSPLADPLSAREREVAELAASGLTSREIGERLYVSKRTVDNHLQRIYTKLGVSGRRELASRSVALADSVPAAP
ncbi:MAG TPA: helix-turn-helix transcriptional regulator, partial [Acidimicrobiales bacterium]